MCTSKPIPLNLVYHLISSVLYTSSGSINVAIAFVCDIRHERFLIYPIYSRDALILVPPILMLLHAMKSICMLAVTDTLRVHALRMHAWLLAAAAAALVHSLSNVAHDVCLRCSYCNIQYIYKLSCQCVFCIPTMQSRFCCI